MSREAPRHADAGLLSSGIFGRESSHRLLQICELICDRGFWGLWHRHQKVPELFTHQPYQRGLERVRTWDDSIISDDIASIRKDAPEFERIVCDTYNAFQTEMFGDGARTPNPHMSHWLRRFYEKTALHPSVRSGQFWRCDDDIIARRIVCADVVRSSFHAVYNELSECAVTLEETTHHDVTPDDSISQVGERAARAPPEPRAPEPPRIDAYPSRGARSEVAAAPPSRPQSVVSVARSSARDPPPRAREASPPPVKRDPSYESVFSRHDAPARAPSRQGGSQVG